MKIDKEILKEERQPWQNQLDANKYLTEVHMDFKKIIGTDYKQAKFSDQDREFIMSMVGVGIMAMDLCPNPEIGEQIKELDFGYINTLAILKFNLDGNMIVDRITNWEKQTGEQEEESNWIEKLTKRINGKSTPTKAREEE